MMTAEGTDHDVRASTAAALRKYCKLDTYAMFAIWKALRSLGNSLV